MKQASSKSIEPLPGAGRSARACSRPHASKSSSDSALPGRAAATAKKSLGVLGLRRSDYKKWYFGFLNIKWPRESDSLELCQNSRTRHLDEGHEPDTVTASKNHYCCRPVRSIAKCDAAFLWSNRTKPNMGHQYEAATLKCKHAGCVKRSATSRIPMLATVPV